MNISILPLWGGRRRKEERNKTRRHRGNGEAAVPSLGADCGQLGANRCNQLGERPSAEGQHPGQALGLRHLWILPSSTQARYSVTSSPEGRNRALPGWPSQRARVSSAARNWATGFAGLMTYSGYSECTWILLLASTTTPICGCLLYARPCSRQRAE